MRTRTTIEQSGRQRSQAMAACLLALLALGVLYYTDKPAAVANDKESKERFEFGAEIEHPFGEKAVKGAPFSAQVILEKSQTLANGVHLSEKMTGALYRDTEGRTRQEFPRDGAPEVVLINDNVAGVLYNLHMFQRSAAKINIGEAHANREMEERKHREIEERERAEHRNREIEEREMMEKTKAVNIERSRKEAEPARKVESLGVQMFEGVQAQVKRYTITIPAGREGNDQPFEIVSERWYSPELQIVVMSKRSDPRTGELVYRLANINRGDPARSLFEAPADFTVREEKTELRRKEK
jgi:hypothetical protein